MASDEGRGNCDVAKASLWSLQPKPESWGSPFSHTHEPGSLRPDLPEAIPHPDLSSDAPWLFTRAGSPEGLDSGLCRGQGFTNNWHSLLVQSVQTQGVGSPHKRAQAAHLVTARSQLP